MQLSDRINRLSESQTIAMSQKARELKAQGHDVISLSLGEPDFDTPEFIKEAAKQAIDDNYSHYMPVPGYLDLRESISTKFQRDNGLDYSPAQICVSTGAKQCIANIVLCMVNPGDEVLLPAPFWVTYEEIVKLAGATPIVIPTELENDFKVTTDELKEHITDRTRLLIFSSPCNPTGSVYSKEELKAIAEVVESTPELYVIADEIYEHINFVGGHHSIGEFIYDRTITVNGVSKAFAMTGWRIGYLGAPEWITKAIVKMQGQFTSGASSIAQRAAKAAVEADPSVCDEMKAAFLKRRDLMLECMQDVEGFRTNLPEGAFYIFPEVSHYFGMSNGTTTIDNATDLSMYLLNDAHVAVVTGEAFGAPNYLRFSYATSEDLIAESIDRVSNSLNKLS